MIKSLLFTILFIAAGSFGIQAAKPEEQSADQTSLTDILPNEVTRMVLEHLSPMQRQGVSRVCSLWRFLSQTLEWPCADEDDEMREIEIGISSPGNWGKLKLLVKSNNVKEDIASLLSKNFNIQISRNQIEQNAFEALLPPYSVCLEKSSNLTTSESLMRIRLVQDIIDIIYTGQHSPSVQAHLELLAKNLEGKLANILKMDFLTRRMRSNCGYFKQIHFSNGDRDIQKYTDFIKHYGIVEKIYKKIQPQLRVHFLKQCALGNYNMLLSSITLINLLKTDPAFEAELASILQQSPQTIRELDLIVSCLNSSPNARAILTNLKNMLPESSVANQEASNKPLLQETTWNTISLLKSPHALLSLVGLAALASIAYFYQTHRSPANQDNQPPINDDMRKAL